MKEILEKILELEKLDFTEAVDLYKNTGLSMLMWLGNEVRKKKVPGKQARWIIDRNINITNICTSRCSFCNFHRTKKDSDGYITGMGEYRQKINELFELGGNQVLLQGGLHPDLGLSFYKDLFSELKREFPELQLHALGPPEIHDLALKENKSYNFILNELISSGLDSLPGAGAEILCDEVRSKIS
ncbi:MAG: radical SAM protein, partial [Bacteroidales bacterium]